ncbi:MAG: hypothetical protein Phyf2KO_15840 [Phycisphaerales bacterium]
MSEQASGSSSFVKAFIPGLIVGFVVGAAVGVIVGSTGGNPSKLTEPNRSVDRSGTVDADRDGYPDEVIDEAQQQGEQLIEEGQEIIDDVQQDIDESTPPTEGDG